MGSRSEGEIYLPLFETKEANGKTAYRLFSIFRFVGISMIWAYRVVVPVKEEAIWVCFFMFLAELWFGFYWIFTQSVRWNRVDRYTFIDRFSQRYENKLPRVDIFVCTADPATEPPMLVINTVLSVMAYNYPTDKLSVYLSDDGGSEITFYALLEASCFAKHWIPFCNKLSIEPRSPAAYFSSEDDSLVDRSSIKRLYEEMKNRIETAAKVGLIPKEIRTKHNGFSEWTSVASPRDHQTILQVLIDGSNPDAIDTDGVALPTLVYLAREKRPNLPHNFKAGAMNALIRVSSKISNGEIILNVDCDMYSNNSESIRDALCFFMDEQNGHEIAFVQFPQRFNNITQNDIYGGSFRVCFETEFRGQDSYGGPMYIGTGCFHRRETLCGKKYSAEDKIGFKGIAESKLGKSASEVEDTTKILADCTCEEGTQWGKEMGLKYNCPVEDVITGLSIHCRGWKSVYFSPKREGFLGIAPNTLAQALVQHKRWSEGNLQILLSKYGPLSRGIGKIKLGHQMAYCIYGLWAPSCLATLCYSVVPPLYLLKGIPLFPKISSVWFLPFAYVIITETTYSLWEFLHCGFTLQTWWHEQRIWMFKRTTSYFFGFADTIFKLLGLANSAFTISDKVVEQDVSQRYEKEIMEFGDSSPMFIILATLALLNVVCLVGCVIRIVISTEIMVLNSFTLQIFLSGLVVALNLPVYQGMFFRKDNGRMPTSVTVKSITLALSACFFILY